MPVVALLVVPASPVPPTTTLAATVPTAVAVFQRLLTKIVSSLLRTSFPKSTSVSLRVCACVNTLAGNFLPLITHILRAQEAHSKVKKQSKNNIPVIQARGVVLQV